MVPSRAAEPPVAAAVRSSRGRVVAVLASATGDLDRAEDAVQDACVSALEVWPRTGVPANPGGWLYVAARRKALDVARREGMRTERERRAVAAVEALDPEVPGPTRLRDDELRLLFTCCHPALALDARVVLALRSVCGLSPAEIAEVLVVGEATVSKRLVRARQKIREGVIPIAHPADDRLAERADGVAAVVHLLYTAGHHSSDPSVVRTTLCTAAVRLARELHDLVPTPSTSGLVALLLLTEARRPARVADDGALVPLAEQDRQLWDGDQVDAGLALLARSIDDGGPVVGPYQLQAAIAALHATAPSYEATDWAEVVRLYDILAEVHPSPVVSLNAAIAVGEVDGPQAALDRLGAVAPAARSHLWHLARAEALARLGDGGADAAFAAAEAAAPTAIEAAHIRRRSRS